VYTALVVQVLGSASFFMALQFYHLNIFQIIAFIFMYLSCLGFIAPNTSALTMAPFTKNAGSASSLLGALQMSLGGLASIGISLVKSHSAGPLAAVMVCASSIALFILITGRSRTVKV
jgi:MFS transporter, DHA1 family, multidrug resistance protein